jgi:hypothetical protein
LSWRICSTRGSGLNFCSKLNLTIRLIKFIIQIFRCSFLKFRIQTKNFSCMSISSYESDIATWS